jgi:hypothetical protein
MPTAEQRDIIVGNFLKPADRTYGISRWCFHNGLYHDFFWNALHATEKYLKAALLMNNKKANAQGHDIIKLHREFKPVAGCLMPDQLQMPVGLDSDYWFAESIEDYIMRLSRFGSPDNRYAMIGYSVHAYDLLKFDNLIFTIRRLVCDLRTDLFERGSSEAEYIGPKSDWLRDNPDKAIPNAGDPWYKSYSQQFVEAVEIYNHAFSRESITESEAQIVRSAGNSPLYMRVFYFAENGTASADDRDRILALVGWVEKHIYLSKDFKVALEDAKKKLNEQH